VDYARFERLVIGIGAAAIVGTAALSLGPATDPVEFVAQLMLLAVLVAAVRWGRRGGTTAAIVATVVYVAAKFLVGAAASAPLAIVEAGALRALLFILVGVVGGEACMRMKLLLARAHDARAIDESSSVYTPLFLGRVLGGVPLLRATLTGKSGYFREDGRFELWGEPLSEGAYAMELKWRPVHTPARSALLLPFLVTALLTGSLLLGWKATLRKP